MPENFLFILACPDSFNDGSMISFIRNKNKPGIFLPKCLKRGYIGLVSAIE